MYLIDTNCLSELTRLRPDANVIEWFSSNDETRMYLSVISLGELVKGIDRLPDSAKKDKLNSWIQHNLKSRFRSRIIPISESIAIKWGSIQATMELRGTPIPAIDALIVATSLVNNLTLVTRNTKDFENIGIPLINPWDANF